MSNHKPDPIAEIEDFIPIPEELQSGKAIQLRDIPELYDPRSQYSVDQKLLCVGIWAVTGSIAETARRTGISKDAIRHWKNESPWWTEAVERIKLQRNERLDAQLTLIMENILKEVNERLEKGDEVVFSNGNKARQKLKAKDMATMMAIFFDKRALGRGDPTSNPGHRESTQNEMLQNLKESFEKLSKDIRRKAEEKIVSEQ